MPRTIPRSQRAFSFAIGVTLILALLPTGWLRPWTSHVADIVNVPVQPFADAGIRPRGRLRPRDDATAGESERVRHLTEELEKARALSHAKQLRIEALEQEIRELQDARRFHRGGEVEIDPLFARITGRSPDRAGGPVRLNVGRRDGVTGGTVAVFRGVHLIGRVAEDVAQAGSWIIPITDPSNRLVEAVILPAGDPLAPVGEAPRILLAPSGPGAFAGDLDAAVGVERGDTVRLSDPTWPASAQGMIVGFVESVSPKDAQPLLTSIVVRPRYHAHHLTSVTLKIERRVGPTGDERP
ncbi:MAG: rod shape-determining protein MreC [Planctomycetota bacterium]|jgi:cell shape-determining protein MreC